MKRVVQVVYSMDCGGIENFIMSMYDEMIAMEVQFDFIYMNENTKVCFFDDKIKKNGGNIFYTGKLNFKSFFKFIKKYREILKDNGPYDALHVHSYYNCGLIACLSKMFGVKRVVTHSHSTKDNKTSNSFLRKIYRVISKTLIKFFADEKIACGIEAGKSLYDKEKFLVINNGINTSKFLNCQKCEIDKIKEKLFIKNEKIVLHVGNFFDVKNHNFIIKIAKKMKESNIDVRFILIGDGNLKENIERMIKDYKLEDFIYCLGLKNNVENYLLLSDVFILPSKYEGFPVSLIEAQSAGLPCIVSNVIDRNVDLGVNEVDFLGIEEEDIKKWINKIVNAHPKKEISQSIKIIEDKYMDSKSCAKKLFEVYYGEKYEDKKEYSI